MDGRQSLRQCLHRRLPVECSAYIKHPILEIWPAVTPGIMPSNRIGALLLLLACTAGASHVPFILIPGLTVPTLEAKFDVKSAPHFYCPKHSKDYEPVYLVTDDLLPGIRDCYTALMLMEVRSLAHACAAATDAASHEHRNMTVISQTPLALTYACRALAYSHQCSTLTSPAKSCPYTSTLQTT